MGLTVGVSPGRYPRDPAAAPLRIAASLSISSSILLSCASLIANRNSLSLPSPRSNHTITLLLSRFVVASARLLRSVGMVAPSVSIRSHLCAIVSRHSVSRWRAVSLPEPHSQPGEVTPGTLRLYRNALRPTFPVRIWTSIELSCFLRPLCLARATSVNSGESAGSMSRPGRSCMALSSCCCHLALQSRSRASSDVPVPSHSAAHSARASVSIPLRGWVAAGAMGASLRPLRSCRFCIALATLLCATRRVAVAPVRASLVSKSATLLFRYRSSGGTQVSVSRLHIGVALYAPATTLRQLDCVVISCLAMPLGVRCL